MVCHYNEVLPHYEAHCSTSAVHARGTPHNTHARAHTHTHTPRRAPVGTCAHAAADGGPFFFFFCQILHGRALGLQTCSSACGAALQRVALLPGCSRRNRTLLQGCNVRARVSLRGPFRGKSFELPRRKARGDGGEPRRARPVSGAAICRGDSKRLGARGSAWPCVSGCAAAVRAWFHVERCARVPRHFGVV